VRGKLIDAVQLTPDRLIAMRLACSETKALVARRARVSDAPLRRPCRPSPLTIASALRGQRSGR
jgi:hypothetical protein